MKKTIITLSVLLASGAAQAQWAVYDYNVHRGVQGVVDAVRGATQSQTAAAAQAAQQAAHNNLAAQAARDREQAAVQYRVADACSAVSGTAGVSDVNRTSSAAASSGRGARYKPTGAPPGMSDKDALMQALATAAGGRAPGSAEQQADTAVTGACGAFADPSSVRGQACAAAGLKTQTMWGLRQNADIDAQTLFDGPQKEAEGFRKRLTVIADDSEPAWTSIKALRRNLDTPLELRALTSSEARTTAGRQYMALRDAYEARMSVSSSPIRSLVMSREAHLGTIEPVRQLLNSDVTAAYTEDYLQRNGLQSWKSRGISRDELTNLEVERRSMNLDWHRNIASQPGDPILKEIAAMLAFDQTQRWAQRQEQREVAVVLGQISSTLTRMEMNAQLNTLHGAASRANK